MGDKDTEIRRLIFVQAQDYKMQEEQYKQMAAQLRQPTGEGGLATAEMMNKGNAQMNRDAIKAVSAEAGDRILELGMGNGYFVKEILNVDPSVGYTGCDFSELMVSEAAKMNAEWVEKGQAEFVFGDVAALPFEDGGFNKIFTVNTIYFWEDVSRAFAELKRMLSPGGKLFLSFRPKYQMEKYPFTQYGFKMYGKEDVEQLLVANGFSEVSARVNREPDFILDGRALSMENVVAESTRR